MKSVLLQSPIVTGNQIYTNILNQSQDDAVVSKATENETPPASQLIQNT